MTLPSLARLALAGLSLTLFGCPRQETFLVAGEPREISFIVADLRLETDGTRTLVIEVASNNNEAIADNDLRFILTAPMPDGLADGQQNVRVDLGLIDARFDYVCFCEADGIAPPVIEGELFFGVFADDTGELQLNGSVDLIARGTSENGIDLGEVELDVLFSTSNPVR